MFLLSEAASPSCWKESWLRRYRRIWRQDLVILLADSSTGFTCWRHTMVPLWGTSRKQAFSLVLVEIRDYCYLYFMDEREKLNLAWAWLWGGSNHAGRPHGRLYSLGDIIKICRSFIEGAWKISWRQDGGRIRPASEMFSYSNRPAFQDPGLREPQCNVHFDKFEFISRRMPCRKRCFRPQRNN